MNAESRINYWAVLVAAVATLIASSLYYTVFAQVWLNLRGADPASVSTAPQLGSMAGQVVRNLVVAFVLATLLRRLGKVTLPAALRVGMLVWFGFQAMAVAGSVLHESYPLGLYALHVGDALMTTLIMVSVLGSWRRS